MLFNGDIAYFIFKGNKMANTIANIKTTSNTWVDVYALTGISVGTPLLIQNVGVAGVTVNISPTLPTDVDGEVIPSLGYVAVEAAASGCWAYANRDVPLAVQNNS